MKRRKPRPDSTSFDRWAYAGRDPEGWDQLAHFGGWTLAYYSGFAALLVEKKAQKGNKCFSFGTD